MPTPKLVDATVLGDRPLPRPGAGAPALQRFSDGGAAGEALEQVGRSIAGAGDAVQRVNDELVKARRGAQLTEAMGKATEELGLLELSFRRDQDFKTAPERFRKETDLVRQRLEKGIDDKLVRQAFNREYGKLSVAKHLNVVQSAATQEADHHRSTLDSSLSTYADAAANALNVAEREIALNQARISIESSRAGGWITDVEAGDRQRALLKKVDGATALRDLSVAPALTANRLATQPTYLPNLDPEQRQRLVDTGYRKAEANVNSERQAAERAEREARDNVMTEALKRMHDGTLSEEYVDSQRAVLGPSNYDKLRTALKKGDVALDDRAAFARVQRALYRDPDEAEALAYDLQAAGKLTNATLSATLGRVRELKRTDGPRSPYERSRAFITDSLEPSAMTQDPAPRARQGLAVKEFDDWFEGERKGNKEPTSEQVQKKASELVQRYAMVDMNKLAERTGLGARNDPDIVLEALRRQGNELQQRLERKTITQQEFNRRMAELNEARLAAERLRGGKP